jgi:UDP-glucose 4-epimerase
MNNILFLGGAGFIGSAVVKEMLLKNRHARIVVLEPPHADTSRLNGCKVEIITGSLVDTELIDRIVADYGITHIVHLVSTMTPASGYADYMQELYDVVLPSIRLMELCARRGIELVYFSSGGAVYGDSLDVEALRESTPLQPISYYGLSKRIMESNIRFEHRVNGLQYLILRPSNPYGHGQRTEGRQGLVAIALGHVLAGQPVTIWGDGSAVRDYIYIDDLAKAVCAVMRSCAVNEAINIGSGTGLTVKEVLGIVGDIVGKPLTVEYDEIRRQDVSRVVLDVSRMRQIYTQPLTAMRQGVSMFWKTLKAEN